MDRRFAYLLLGLLAGVAFIVGAYGLIAGSSPSYQASFGEPIRQDDFTYTVVGVSKADAIGDDGHRVVARGRFYVATIEVANHAMRVDYRWDPSIAYVTDAAGVRYQFSLEAERALGASHPIDPVVAAGETRRFQVAFDLPRGIRQPALAYSNGILMGDVFDFAAYSRARIPLE